MAEDRSGLERRLIEQNDELASEGHSTLADLYREAADVIGAMRRTIRDQIGRCHQCQGTGIWKVSTATFAAGEMPCLDCEQARAVLARLKEGE